MDVKLVVLDGPQKGRVIPLPLTLFVIGRGPLCHLRPHCTLVSNLHCAIARWGGRVLVRDLKSANGTYLNNQRIQGEMVARDGDVLRVGKLVFAFRVRLQEADPKPEPVAVDQVEVEWLLESPSDSVTLQPAQRTLTPPAAVADEPPRVPSSTGSGDISAGQYLRDYFHQHRNGRPG
jgi:pSer/pThr/pTyr-binding forkhead associated (FHA) protein